MATPIARSPSTRPPRSRPRPGRSCALRRQQSERAEALKNNVMHCSYASAMQCDAQRRSRRRIAVPGSSRSLDLDDPRAKSSSRNSRSEELRSSGAVRGALGRARCALRDPFKRAVDVQREAPSKGGIRFTSHRVKRRTPWERRAGGASATALESFDTAMLSATFRGRFELGRYPRPSAIGKRSKSSGRRLGRRGSRTEGRSEHGPHPA